MDIEQEIHDLQEKLKCKLSYLKNIHRENKCFMDFMKEKKLMEEYEIWRKEYYQNRQWK